MVIFHILVDSFQIKDNSVFPTLKSDKNIGNELPRGMFSWFNYTPMEEVFNLLANDSLFLEIKLDLMPNIWLKRGMCQFNMAVLHYI